VTFSTDDISQLIMSLGAAMVAGSILLAVLTAALRLGVRPLLADWAKLKGQDVTSQLALRMVELEAEVRQLRMGGGSFQLPSDPLRPISRT
jgi:hypothetical protein